MALLFGVVDAAGFLNRDNLLPPLLPERVHPFMVAWSVHIGSYAGAALGTLGCVVLIEIRRRAAAREGVRPLRA
jgi:hypothetical protein